MDGIYSCCLLHVRFPDPVVVWITNGRITYFPVGIPYSALFSNFESKKRINSNAMQRLWKKDRLLKQMDGSITPLIEACRKGNSNAQMLLYKQYACKLYAACLRIVGNSSEAEEAMQDAFLKIFGHMDQYREGSCFEAWMQRVAVHTAIDYVRRQQPVWEELPEQMAFAENDEEMTEEAIGYSVQQVKAAILQLPDGYRIILSLYLLEGYDVEEISSILNIKQVTVRTQYLRAKKRLLDLIPRVQYG